MVALINIRFLRHHSLLPVTPFPLSLDRLTVIYIYRKFLEFRKGLFCRILRSRWLFTWCPRYLHSVPDHYMQDTISVVWVFNIKPTMRLSISSKKWVSPACKRRTHIDPEPRQRLEYGYENLWLINVGPYALRTFVMVSLLRLQHTHRVTNKIDGISCC